MFRALFELVLVKFDDDMLGNNLKLKRFLSKPENQP